MSKVEPFKEDFALLVEASFIAIHQYDEDSALKLLKAAEVLDPENTLLLQAMGYLHFCKLALNQAKNAYEELLKRDPGHELARVMIALCLAMNPAETVRGLEMLEEAKAVCVDPEALQLIEASVLFVKKAVKQKPAHTRIAAKAPVRKKKKASTSLSTVE